MIRRVAAILILGGWVVGLSPAAAAAGRPFTFEEMMKVRRVADPQLSPDGKWIAYTITTVSVEKNNRNSELWLVPAAGGEPVQLTRNPAADEHPRWSPNSKKLAFLSRRAGSSQIWLLPVAGGEPLMVNTAGLEVNTFQWAPDGKSVAFTTDVFPSCADLACTQEKLKQLESNPVKAKLVDRLLFRHWNSWKDGKRSHLFLASIEGGIPRDLTPGDYDVPPFSLGGPDGYVFSPDGKEICFVRNTDPDEALSTNGDLWMVPVDGSAEAIRITRNPADDTSPVFSPDGKYVAYRAQSRAGYEADRWQLMVFDRATGQSRSLTAAFDRNVEEIVWSPDSRTLYFPAGDQAYEPIFKVSLSGGAVSKVLASHSNSDLEMTPDGGSLVFLRQSLTSMAEIFSARVDGSQLKPLTESNQALLAELDLREPESVWFAGAGGDKVQAWILKPPGFDPARKYPLLLAIHGGPQGVWGDSLSYRWNLQVFAARGFVVMAPNPRGSTTFGQDFTDGIRGDWGGKVYEDLIKGVDYAISLGYVDPERLAAAGGSYGGYMVNWIAGHTDRFKCLISHAGAFNLTSKWGVTEELWFPEWELLGTPWTSRDQYEKWSPHLSAQNFKTPTLVIHGELDYRVPIGEAFQMFTTLQRMRVPSKMLYYPDEGHWVTKPKNSELWYHTFLGWLDQYLK